MLQTFEEVRKALDDIRNGADHSSTQMVADIVRLVGSEIDDDERAIANGAAFFSSLSHDQCLALGAALVSASELLTLMLAATAAQHARVCTGRHGSPHLN